MSTNHFVGKRYAHILDTQMLSHIQWRAGDIVISGPPRCGTNWVQHIVYQLLSGGDTDFRSIRAVVPVFGVRPAKMTSKQKVDLFNARESPRALKTHFGPPVLPVVSSVRYIVVVRNVRDIPNSLFRFMNSFSDFYRETYGIPRYGNLDELMEDYGDMAFYFDFINAWTVYAKNRKVIFVHYADLKRDLRGQIARIADFAGVEADAQTFETILAHCSFEWMKQNQSKFELEADGSTFIERGDMIRAGQANAGKSELMPDILRRIDIQAQKLLDPRLRKWADDGGAFPPP